LPLLYRRIAVALIAVFALLAGSAASALAQSPKPDPAPAAQHQATTPKATSSGSTHDSPSPLPAPASTPAPVVTPAPATSSAPVSTPSTSQPAATAPPKHEVTHRAKAKAAAKKAHHAKPAAKEKAKPVVRAAKPAAARPVVHSSPANVSTLPVVPPAGSSGSSLSNRSVLLITILFVIAAGILALVARGLWRRVWWWRQYHAYGSPGRQAGDDDAFVEVRAAPMEPWSDEGKANGANGAALDDEPVKVATSADGSTGR
jgi:hypothetical protein